MKARSHFKDNHLAARLARRQPFREEKIERKRKKAIVAVTVAVVEVAKN